ncbi:MAG: YdcF family protein [Spirochaeta sp.]
MRILQDIIEAFILPPGIILLTLTAGCILAAVVRRRGIIIFLFAVSACILYAASTEAAAGILLRNLEDRYQAIHFNNGRINDFTQEDIIVVLGAGTVPGDPNGIGLSPTAVARLSGGAMLHLKTGAPIVVSGGIVYDRETNRSEAEHAADWLEGIGIDPDMVSLESGSKTTAENAHEVEKMLRQQDRHPRILLITSAYHMPRAMYSFRDYPGTVVPVPVDYKAVRAPLMFQSFLPGINQLRNTTIAVRELIGLAAYAAGIE